MKIIFMGTPAFAIPALTKLINSSENEVVAVFTSTPKSKGRGLKEICSPVHELAKSCGLPVYTPTSLKKTETINLVSSIEADIIVVAAYGFLIPKDILYNKQHGSLNIHPSALPKYRGAAPLQRTIINGDLKTAVCVMQMNEGLDTGEIIMQEEIILDQRITLQQLSDRSAEIGANLLIETLKNISVLPRIPQKEDEEIIYAAKLEKEEGRVNWQESAYKIDCKIRGMNPWPGVYFEYKGKIIKLLEADFDETEHNFLPGTVVSDNLKIACGRGFLQLRKLQQAGKKPLKVEDFLCGIKIGIDTIL